MLRLIGPFTLIIVAFVGFFTLVSPNYDEVKSLKAQVTSYNEVLNDSKSLENERDKLTKKFNTMTSENLDKLEKLIPDNVDNIHLILEVEKLASPYGMVLRDIKYDTLKKEKTPVNEVFQSGTTNLPSQKNYGTWDLEFSTEGSYSNFLKFLKDLESNLRIVDITSVQFSSVTTSTANPDVYKYGFQVKTYWLKN